MDHCYDLPAASARRALTPFLWLTFGLTILFFVVIGAASVCIVLRRSKRGY